MYPKTIKTTLAVLGFATAALFGTQSASAATYNFKAAANSGGGIGESIFSTFSTSSFFAGPNLDITASATDDNQGDTEQFVYFDNGNGGMGVCKDPNSAGTAAMGTFTNAGTNLCEPGSDDGITSIYETLTFTATTTAMVIQSIWMNANHDDPSVLDAIYTINGVDYGAGSMIPHSLSQTGDVRIDLGFTLNVGDSFSITPKSGSPDSYISGIAVAPVPLPAAGLLLLTAFGGLAAMRRRKQKAV